MPRTRKPPKSQADWQAWADEKNRTHPLKPDRPGAALPYNFNVRLSQEQGDAIFALEQREGLHRSEAIRRAIDEWMGGRMLETGELLELSFTAVPELDHVEFAIVTRDAESGRTHRQEINLDPEHAHQLLGELSAAVERLEGDR